MKKCIYCLKDKEDDQFSLEHVIPQFLGGAFAPDNFKIRAVCKTCNNNLGLFVDASFRKNFLVYNTLVGLAHAFYNPQNPIGLPLRCMGVTEFTPPEMSCEEVCELWFGPLGEQIYWVRPNDSRMSHYMGGNPITSKKVRTRAYFFFSQRSSENLLLSWLSFRDAFEGSPVTKVMCTPVGGEDPKDIGFSEPDALDTRRTKYFSEVFSESPARKLSVDVHKNFDLRFVAKIAIGVVYVLLGPKILLTPYMTELRNALWYRDSNPVPLVNGSILLTQKDEAFDRLTGEKNAVTITIGPNGGNIVVVLNILAAMSWTVMC